MTPLLSLAVSPQKPLRRLRLWGRISGTDLTVAKLARLLNRASISILQWDESGKPDGITTNKVTAILRQHGIDPAGIWEFQEVQMKDNVIQLHPQTPKPKAPKKEKLKPMEYGPLEVLPPDVLQYFALPADPFDNSENPEDVWLSGYVRTLENSLLRTLKLKGIAALVGDPGSGKSTLLRRMYGRLATERKVKLISPASLDRTRITSAALATAIIRDLTSRDTGAWSQEARSELLRNTLQDQVNGGITPILTLDEAHLLPDRAMIAIKQVWDAHIQFRQLSVLMVGQLPLRERLMQSVTLRELTGRTALFEMPKLARHEKGTPGTVARNYLAWRWARVGADVDKVFAPDAWKVLETRAEYPLWLNNLAMRSMMYAASQGAELVTAIHAGRS